MFLDNSRYARTPRDEVETRSGRRVTAIRLRRLPLPPAGSREVKQGDRLDLLAQKQFGDGTKYWHIADANTAVEAKTLVERVLGALKIPRS